MIKIKNTKSDKELVAHDYKDGKVIFNPGSQTGAKKSDYMFNDMTMPIPGSNFQVTIKPQQEIEINADNSIQDIALQSIAKEIGATVDNIQPPPHSRYDSHRNGVSYMGTSTRNYHYI